MANLQNISKFSNAQQIMFYATLLLLFIVFFALVNPFDINNTINVIIVIASIFGISLIILLMFFSIKEGFDNKLIKKYATRYFGIILTAIIFTIIASIPILLIGNQSMVYSGGLLILGILALVITFTLVTYIGFRTFIAKADDRTYFGLIKNIIFYVPCLLIDLIESFKLQYKLTTRTSIILLIVDIIVIALYFNYNKLKKKVKITKVVTLLENPVYLNNKKVIGSFEDLEKMHSSESIKTDKPDNTYFSKKNKEKMKEDVEDIIIL